MSLPFVLLFFSSEAPDRVLRDLPCCDVVAADVYSRPGAAAKGNEDSERRHITFGIAQPLLDAPRSASSRTWALHQSLPLVRGTELFPLVRPE